VNATLTDERIICTGTAIARAVGRSIDLFTNAMITRVDELLNKSAEREILEAEIPIRPAGYIVHDFPSR
jgi:hypothetical protein